MAGIIRRQKFQATNNLVAGGDGKSGSASYTSWDADGFATAASSARTYKELWFNAYQLLGGQPQGDSACTHATSGSLSACTLGSGACGGVFYTPTISACGTACDMQIHAAFPAPLDMDVVTTTASPILIVEHGLNAAFTTTGCTIGYRINYNYVTAGSTGTAGSMQQGIVAAGACVAGARVSGSLGEFPVPAATGQMLHFALRQLTGACGQGSTADVVGIRFRYISSIRGTKVT